MSILVDEKKLRDLLTNSFLLYEVGLKPINIKNEIDLIVEACKKSS